METMLNRLQHCNAHPLGGVEYRCLVDLYMSTLIYFLGVSIGDTLHELITALGSVTNRDASVYDTPEKVQFFP